MKAVKRCAIYTRKSSEEGLDQEFNSLDAQREGGEAYVKSQASEGWRVLPERYDDGGFSGASMERPAIKRLLADIEAGQVDVVVVYKIDRLTRSLADFARMVELFDRKGISFVSVTQAFNTTSSMGRLTLNVLLSFAQFEREVTGERIRDKIAASKAKGMWMGGVPPLGYDLPLDKSRTLAVNEAEAETVRSIFRSYLELGSVHALQQHLLDLGIRSKQRVTRGGRSVGGEPFSRGAIFYLLRNRIYRGMIVHKGHAHAGAHVPIVDGKLFDAVQARLVSKRTERAETRRERLTQAPLTGRLFDADGHPMSPTASRGKSGRRYRYYVSAPLQQGIRTVDDGDQIRRVPAEPLERLLRTILQRLAQAKGPDALAIVRRVEIHAHTLELLLPLEVHACVRRNLRDHEHLFTDEDSIRIVLPTRLRFRSGNTWVDGAISAVPRLDNKMIKALRAGHSLVEPGAAMFPAPAESPASPYLRRLIRLAMLAPDIQQAIVDGRQPAGITLERLTRSTIPLLWLEQRRLFGFHQIDLRRSVIAR